MTHTSVQLRRSHTPPSHGAERAPSHSRSARLPNLSGHTLQLRHTDRPHSQFRLGHFPPNIPHLLTSAPRRARPTPKNTLIREARASVRGWRRSKEHRLRLRWWFDSFPGQVSSSRWNPPHPPRHHTSWQMISRRPPSMPIALKSLASLCTVATEIVLNPATRAFVCTHVTLS